MNGTNGIITGTEMENAIADIMEGVRSYRRPEEMQLRRAVDRVRIVVESDDDDAYALEWNGAVLRTIRLLSGGRERGIGEH